MRSSLTFLLFACAVSVKLCSHAEHVLRKINHCTFRADYTIFPFYRKKFKFIDEKFSRQPQIHRFYPSDIYKWPKNYLFSRFMANFSFLINRKLWPNLCYLSFRIFTNDLTCLFSSYFLQVPVFHFFVIQHYKNHLSSLHIFVHYCTFCASLHVKTSPAATNVNMW